MENINSKLFDHTLLKAFATEEEIKKLCLEAKTYNFKSVCVNPCHVAYAKELLKDTDVLVCTVIGFPLGANTMETKWFETQNALENGADEVDVVINIGKAKEHDYKYIENEVAGVVAYACGATVKVIIETCYLSDEEKVEVCKACTRAKANFVKTSTGFGTAGAKKEDVRLMKNSISENMEVKASGGIHSAEDVLDMIEAGATRIGASASVKIMEAAKEE